MVVFSLGDAIRYLRPGVDFADIDGTLAHVRWDTPDVIPPTEQEVADALARLSVPQEVTAANFVRALDQAGLLDQVNAAVDGAGGLTKALWNHASFFRRDDPMLMNMAAAVGQTAPQLDDLFRLAATFP
jgi:hypothetical protein